MKRYVLLFALLGESLCASGGMTPSSPEREGQPFSWVTPSKMEAFSDFVGRVPTKGEKASSKDSKKPKKSKVIPVEVMLSTPHKDKDALQRKRQEVIAEWHSIEMTLRQDILEKTIRDLVEANATLFHPNLSEFVDSQDENGLTLLHRLVMNSRIKTTRDPLYSYLVKDLRARTNIGVQIAGVSRTVDGILAKNEHVPKQVAASLASTQPSIPEPPDLPSEEDLGLEKNSADDDVPSLAGDLEADLSPQVSPIAGVGDGLFVGAGEPLQVPPTPHESSPPKINSTTMPLGTPFPGSPSPPIPGTPPAGGSSEKPQKSSSTPLPTGTQQSKANNKSSRAHANSTKQTSFFTINRALLLSGTAAICMAVYKYSTFSQTTSIESLGSAAKAA